MRVLRLTPWYYHDQVVAWPAEYDAVGGMQVQITRLSRLLARHGVEQTVVTVGFPGLPKVRQDAEGLTVRIARLPLPRWRSELTGLVGLVQAWFLASLAHCVRLRRWRPDLIHVHADGTLWPLLLAPLAASILNAPYVLTVHCSRLAVYSPMSRWDRWQHRLVVAAEKSAISRAARVVTLTAATAQIVATRIPGAAGRTAVVPDFMDNPARAGGGDGDHGRFAGVDAAVAKGRPVIGFVGRIAHEKGWRHLVSLALALRDLDPFFLVVGDGPQRDRLTQQVAAHGLDRDFLVTGFVANAVVPDALDLMTVVVMPSEHEEFGGTALEALLAGTPVVAFAVGGLRNIVGDVTPETLAGPGDQEDLAKRLRSVIEDPQPVLDRIRQARPALADRYGPEPVRRLTLHLYSQVLAGAPSNSTAR